jgi:ketosteroid isomerase-like protein
MSQENVDRVRRGMEHWVRTGEVLWVDLHPEIEVHDHDIPDAGVYRGHDGVRDWTADFSSAFESFALEPQEYIDGGDGKVVLVVRLSARGKASGVSVERLDGMVWTIRDGKTVRLDYYGSRAEALEAAGVLED